MKNIDIKSYFIGFISGIVGSFLIVTLVKQLVIQLIIK